MASKAELMLLPNFAGQRFSCDAPLWPSVRMPARSSPTANRLFATFFQEFHQ
jgi:hypothetical protein